ERRNEVIGKLKQEVNDISMSRATLAWGIPLPWDRSQTTYVWVDALVNYLTAVGYPQDSARLDHWWPADLHLMAKDILWFHAVIWPALLLAAGLKLPKKIFAHGFFTVNGQKMSKSLGNVVRPGELIAQYGVDGTRYLLLSAFPFGADGDFTADTMKTGYNAALANDLGNLVSRSFTMVEKYCFGRVPAGDGRDLVQAVLTELQPMDLHIDHLQFHQALATLLLAVDHVNRFIEEKSPWKLIKTSPAETEEVLHQVLLCVKLLAYYLFAFMPDTAQAIWTRLGETDDGAASAGRFFLDPTTLDLKPGQQIQRGEPLFPRK
ncbi:MAG TPA: methionine--tRNA ligase, partial [Elusimicrobiota bacterium]|nr:methionine--tRNA ligase [Elusimicrobiota bacterium]